MVWNCFVHFSKRWSLQQMFIVTGTQSYYAHIALTRTNRYSAATLNTAILCTASLLLIAHLILNGSDFVVFVQYSVFVHVHMCIFVCLIIFRQPHVALDIYIYQSRAKKRMTTITPGAYIWCCCYFVVLFLSFDLIIIHPFFVCMCGCVR